MNAEDEVHGESTDVGPSGPAAMRLSGGAPRVVLTLPLGCMIRGYVQAVRRFEAAASESPEAAWDVYAALFEASHWIDSLASRTDLASDAQVQAFRFVRHRTHHHFSAAVFFDEASTEWTWGPAANMPLPEDPKYRQEKLERPYEQLLAGRPVREVMHHIEKLVVALDLAEDFR